MKRIIYILLINQFAFAQTATLDTNFILIGEQIKLNISNNINETNKWPTYEDFLIDGLEIIKADKIDTNNNTISQNFIITAWDSGTYYIPPITFSEKSKTEGILLTVATINIEEGAELKDIKAPMNAPIGWSDIWPWITGILIICLIFYILKKYFSTKKKTIISKPKIIIPADVTALNQLSKLEKAKLWEQGNIKEYHAQLSEIIRRYMENRFKFIALELTTDEILRELKSIVSDELSNNLKTILQRADLAKFAKSKPIDNENTESMRLAKQFVQSTKKQQE
ncbi:MAG: hypothetical protein VX689_01330 [Bacteroidota bacterium]|nr:hypothetical protein [Bacteroidota bacterium]